MQTTPHNLTTRFLERDEYIVDRTERRVPGPAGAQITQDLFGFIDLMAVSSVTMLMIQATTKVHVNARIEKIASLTSAKRVLNLPFVRDYGAMVKIEVWGWYKPTRKHQPAKIGRVSQVLYVARRVRLIINRGKLIQRELDAAALTIVKGKLDKVWYTKNNQIILPR